MSAQDVLLIVLIVAAIGVTGLAAWALIELAKASRSIRDLSETMDSRLVPLIEKADVSLDLFNAEVMRVDGIITQVEEVSGRVTTTSETVTDVVRAPLAFIVNFADRVRRSNRAG